MTVNPMASSPQRHPPPPIPPRSNSPFHPISPQEQARSHSPTLSSSHPKHHHHHLHHHHHREDSSTVATGATTMGGHSSSSPFNHPFTSSPSSVPISPGAGAASTSSSSDPLRKLKNKKGSGDDDNEEEEEETTLRVVGIAFVIEEVGKGARLAFRYPANNPITGSNSSSSKSTSSASATRRGSSSSRQGNNGNSRQQPSAQSSSSSAAATTMNQPQVLKTPITESTTTIIEAPPSSELFFSLPSRTIAKLFRLKPPLCGQPLTLSVGGTIFCCRAVLLQRDDDDDDDENNDKKKDENDNGGGDEDEKEGDNDDDDDDDIEAGNKNNSSMEDNSSSLVLFSIIVALAPSRTRKKKFKSLQQRQLNQAWSSASYPAVSDNSHSSVSSSAANNAVNPTFASVRCVHLSLARLCRVLHREENRCNYVSREAKRMIEIQRSFKLGEVSTSTFTTSAANTDISKSVHDAAAATDGNEQREKERKRNDGNIPGGNAADGDGIATSDAQISSQQQERQQEMRPRAVSTASSTMLDGGGSGSGDGVSSGGSYEFLACRKKEENRQALVELMLASTNTTQPKTPFHNNYCFDDYNGDDDLSSSSSSSSSSSEEDDNREENVLKAPSRRQKRRRKRTIETYYFGNLARDIANTYHALSRKSNDVLGMLPTPPSLLGEEGGRNSSSGVVHVNGHIAVPIEDIATSSSSSSTAIGDYDTPYQNNLDPRAVVQSILSPSSSPPSRSDSKVDVIRPYHTLLFPHASPSELLQAMSYSSAPHSSSGAGGENENISSGDISATTSSWGIASSSQRLQRLLSSCNPRKTLEEISIDAALPLFVVLELATHLIERNVCVKSSVVNRYTKFACEVDAVKKMKCMSLPFAQKFGGRSSGGGGLGVDAGAAGGGGRTMNRSIPIFMAVSAITSSTCKSLGDVMTEASSEVLASVSGDGRARAASEDNGGCGASAASGINSVGGHDSSGGGNNRSTIGILGERIADSFGEIFVTQQPPKQQQPPQLPTIGDPMQAHHSNHPVRMKSPQMVGNANSGSSGGIGPSSILSPVRKGTGGFLVTRPSSGGGVKKISAVAAAAAASAGGTIGATARDSITAVEETIYAMAVWLRSHSVIVEVKEYLVSIGAARAGGHQSTASLSGDDTTGIDGTNIGETKAATDSGGTSLPHPPGHFSALNHMPGNHFVVSPPNEQSWMFHASAAGVTPGATNLPSISPRTPSNRCQEEILYEELLESGCLVGNISTVAMSWKLGIDPRRLRRLRDWGVRGKKIEVVTRVPMPGDDWGAP